MMPEPLHGKSPAGASTGGWGGSGGWEEDFWGWVGHRGRLLPGAGVEEICWRDGEMVWDKGWMGSVEVAKSHIQAGASQASATQPLCQALGISPLTWPA